MKRAVAACAALLLAGCASGGSPAPPGGIVRTTTAVSADAGPGGHGIIILESYADANGVVTPMNVPAEQIWELLPAVYEGLKIPVATSVPDTRTIGNRSLTVNRTLAGGPPSRSVSCGNGPTGAPLADSHRLRLSVVTELEPAPNGRTLVRTLVTGTASNPAVSGSPVTCASTGFLESAVVQGIKAQLER